MHRLRSDLAPILDSSPIDLHTTAAMSPMTSVRRLAAFACAAAAAFGLLRAANAAAAQIGSSAQPKTGGTLHLGSWAGRGPLNPYVANSKPTSAFAELVFDGLARVAPDGSYQPDLAAQLHDVRLDDSSLNPLYLKLVRTHWLRVGLIAAFALLQAWMLAASAAQPPEPRFFGRPIRGRQLRRRNRD